MVKIKHQLIYIFLFVISITVVLLFSNFFQKSNLDIFDFYTQRFRQEKIPNQKVKMILVDDHSLSLYGQLFGRWPWPRAVYKDILDFINMGNPKAIYFDFLFSEDEADQESSQIFRQALLESGNAHVGMIFSEEFDPKHIKTSLPERVNNEFSLDNVGLNKLELKHYYNYQLPIDSVIEGIKSLPVYTSDSDVDGVYRRFEFVYKFGDNYYPSLALSAIRELQDSNTSVIYKRKKLVVGDYKVPLSDDGSVLLNWYPRGFDPYSISGIFASLQSIMEGEEDGLLVNPQIFKDSIVIIGASAVGLHDLKPTPISEILPGSEMHATLISNILSDEVLKVVGKLIRTFFVFFFSFITIYSLLFFHRFVKYFAPPFFMIDYVLFSMWLFNNVNVYLPVASAVFSLILTYVISISYMSFVENKEKQKIRRTFSKYLSPSVMEEVLTRHDDIMPEIGKKVEATILFSDIRSFTTISEHYPVELVVGLLNEYFESMINEIHHNAGTLDKMIGDAIMAFWNSPIEIPDHALRAVETSFMMQSMIDELNKEWKVKGYPTIRIGIGINTGEVIIGNIGARSRLDYTAIGDNVNLGSRLEGLCKKYGSKIVISEYTYNKINHRYVCRILDRVTVKGKMEPITIYEPVNRNEELVFKWNGIFRDYLDRKWDVTLKKINDFLELYPGDVTAKMYKERVLQFISNPPGESWDGVEVMMTK